MSLTLPPTAALQHGAGDGGGQQISGICIYFMCTDGCQATRYRFQHPPYTVTDADVDKVLYVRQHAGLDALAFDEHRIRLFDISDRLVARLLTSEASSTPSTAALVPAEAWFRASMIASGPAEQRWLSFYEEYIEGKWENPTTKKAFSNATEAWRELN